MFFQIRLITSLLKTHFGFVLGYLRDNTYCVITYCVITYCVITYCVITYCVRTFITFCVKKLLHFALPFLLHFASILLHFALSLHFAAVIITICVSITFCGVTTRESSLIFKTFAQFLFTFFFFREARGYERNSGEVVVGGGGGGGLSEIPSVVEVRISSGTYTLLHTR